MGIVKEVFTKKYSFTTYHSIFAIVVLLATFGLLNLYTPDKSTHARLLVTAEPDTVSAEIERTENKQKISNTVNAEIKTTDYQQQISKTTKTITINKLAENITPSIDTKTPEQVMNECSA